VSTVGQFFDLLAGLGHTVQSRFQTAQFPLLSSKNPLVPTDNVRVTEGGGKSKTIADTLIETSKLTDILSRIADH